MEMAVAGRVFARLNDRHRLSRLGLSRLGLIRLAFGCGLLAVLLGLATAALAGDDAGAHTFFREETERAEGPAQDLPAAPPLTIRRRAPREASRRPSEPAAQRKAAAGQLAALPPHARPAPGAAAGEAARPSLYTDRTLRRGDVVMLKSGLRVFAGSQQFPYVDKDFVKLDKASGGKRQFQGTLQAIADNQERR